MISNILIVFSVVAASLATVALVRPGGRLADRIVALDVFLASAIALAIAAALATRRAEFLDVGLVLALVGFVATAGWARLVERAGERPPPGSEGDR